MDHHIATALSTFDAISLDGLNGKPAMLERLDNKYIVPADRLLPAFQSFSDLFDVLEIRGKRSFTYATQYYDDGVAQSYLDHHQGHRKRCKVRVRSYVDAGFIYLDVKLKDIRDVTVKKRLKLDGTDTGLSAEALAFIDHCHLKFYGTPLGRALLPAIEMQYERVTLVAKEGGERMTIDTSLRFRNAALERHVVGGQFILETKSARGNGIADKILRSHHLHPTRQSSKYCMGMAALGTVDRHNHFMPELRKLQVFEHPLMTRQQEEIAAQGPWWKRALHIGSR